MIDLSKLTTADTGKWVWYKPKFGAIEKGRLKTFNEAWIFVVYKCDNQWGHFLRYTSAATDPADLEFIEHAEHCRADKGFFCACLPEDLQVKEEELV